MKMKVTEYLISPTDGCGTQEMVALWAHTGQIMEFLGFHLIEVYMDPDYALIFAEVPMGENALSPILFMDEEHGCNITTFTSTH